MKVTCPSCQTTYNIDDKRLPAGGAKLKCAKCQSTFPVKPGEDEAVALPEPTSFSRSQTMEMPSAVAQSLRAASAAPPVGGPVPLPSSRNTSRMGFGFDEPTVTRTRPVADPFGLSDEPPADFDAGAVPLPPASAPDEAIPLPSGPVDFAQTGAVPLPGGNPFGFDRRAQAVADEEVPFADDDAIPLPGTAAPPSFGAESDDVDFDAPTRTLPNTFAPAPGSELDAIPLPGSAGAAPSFDAAPADGSGFAAPDEVDFDAPTRTLPNTFAAAPGSDLDAIPLPGSAEPAQPFEDASTYDPGFAEPEEADFDSPTRILPNAYSADPGGVDAIPLPGGAEASAPFDDQEAGSQEAGSAEAIPLPGYAPADDFGNAETDFDASTRTMPAAIPLPGSAPAEDFGTELPPADETHFGDAEADFDASTRTMPAALPLPGGSEEAFSFGAAPGVETDFADAGADAFAEALPSEDALPLPGEARSPDGFGVEDDLDAATRTLPVAFQTAAPARGFAGDANAPDLGVLPLPGGAIPLPSAPSALVTPPPESGYGPETETGQYRFEAPQEEIARPYGATPEAPASTGAIPLPATPDAAISLPSPFGAPAEDLHADADFVDESDFASVDTGPHAIPLPSATQEPAFEDPFEQATRLVPNPMGAPQAAGGFDFASLEPTPAAGDDAGFATFGEEQAPPADYAFSSFDALPPLDGDVPSTTAVTSIPRQPPPPLDDFGSEDDAFNEPTRVAPIPDLDKLRAASLHAEPSQLAPPLKAPPPPPDLPFPSVPAAPPEEDPFADLPAFGNAAPADDPFADLPMPAQPAAASDDPFADLPMPLHATPPQASVDDPFADLPSPSAAPDPFADLPSPHDAPLPDDNPFADLPPAPPPSFNPSVDFGGVDLAGEPDPEPTQPQGGGEDPFASISLEAHETKRVPSAGALHHLRLRNGQVDGPFDEQRIQEMLGSGELVGNEEISPDGASWSPIGSVPVFQALIEKSAGAHAAVSSLPRTGADPMDRLKQMYGGRMAAVSVVERKDPLEKVRGKLKPMLVGAGLLALLGGGLSVGLTRYGPFGIKYFAPAKISQGSPAAALLDAARKSIVLDTFDSYRKARVSAEKVLAIREYPVARAVWCQAIFYLQRRYAAATPGDLVHAQAALEDIELLGKKNPDVAKAFAGAALTARHPQEAVPVLQEAIARDPNDDPELSLLLAEATAAQGQPKDAIATLERLVSHGAKSAKAFHALGDLYQAQKDAAKATKAYQDALALSPEHVISDVELAAVELLLDKKVEEAQKALDTALDDKNRQQMGPAELARAQALKGFAYAEQFKLPEAAAVLEEALKADHGSLFAKATLARVYLAQHEYEKALPLFQAAELRDPHNLEYTDGYLSSLIATGKMSDALSAVAQASGRFPDNARIAFLTARVNDALEHTSDAERHYRRALSADPTMVDAYIYLGRLYLRGKRLDDAGTLLETAAQKAPDNAAVHAGLGELRLAKGDTAAAETEFQKATELDPTLAVAHLGLAGVDLALNKLDVAKTEAEKALSLDPHLQDGHLQLGRILWKQGALKDALTQLELAKQEAPDSGAVAVTIGAVKLAQEDLAGAESALLTSLARDPLDPEGHFYLGQVKLAEGQVTQAVDELHSALERNAKNAAYHYQLGLALKANKDVATAITEWETAAKLATGAAATGADTTAADAFEALGKTYLDQGRFDDAVAAFDSGLKADPTRSEIYGLQGDCFFQGTRWREAINKYQAALKANPKLVALYYKIGRAYGESGQPDEAIRWYQKATETDPTNAMPYYYLGFSFKEHGRKKEAISAFKLYLAKKPTAPDRKDIEDEIYDLGQP